MTKLTPWSASDMTDVERRLLEAAKHDGIPSQLTSRMAAALQSHAANTGLSGHALGRAGGMLFSKTGLWGLLSVAILVGAAAWYANVAAVPQAKTTPAPPPPEFYASSPDAIASPALEPALPASSSTPNERAPDPVVRTRGNLSAEIALLARAREALASDALERAGRVLEQYRRRFEHGELEPEAEALQIELLVKLGAVDRARRRARNFLSLYPKHPLAERVAQLLDRRP